MKECKMTEQNNRDKMLQRVMNLRAKAENDGASESEMQSAFTMAAKLMDAYNIEEAELALAETEGRIVLDIINKVVDTSCLNGKQRHKIVLCLAGVSAFTSTKAVYNRYSGAITFTGHRPDVELSNYLIAVIKEALDREYENYRMNNKAVGYGAKTAFQTSMASRISLRLFQMAQEADENRRKEKVKAESLQIENTNTSSSTALVISEIAEMKRKEVDAAYRKAHPRLRTSASFSFGNNTTAHGAGRSAGDRVNLNRAISSGSQRRVA
jgi:hypothetical protein